MDDWEAAFIEKSVRRRRRGRRRKLINRGILFLLMTGVIGLGFWAIDTLPDAFP